MPAPSAPAPADEEAGVEEDNVTGAPSPGQGGGAEHAAPGTPQTPDAPQPPATPKPDPAPKASPQTPPPAVASSWFGYFSGGPATS